MSECHVLFTPHPDTAHTDESPVTSNKPFNESLLFDMWQEVFKMPNTTPTFYIEMKDIFREESKKKMYLLNSSLYSKFKEIQIVFYKMPDSCKNSSSTSSTTPSTTADSGDIEQEQPEKKVPDCDSM